MAHVGKMSLHNEAFNHTYTVHHSLAIVHMYVPLVVWINSTCVSSRESDCFVWIYMLDQMCATIVWSDDTYILMVHAMHTQF